MHRLRCRGQHLLPVPAPCSLIPRSGLFSYMTASDFPHFPRLFLTSPAFELAASSCLHPERGPGEPRQTNKKRSKAPCPVQACRCQLPAPLLPVPRGQPSLHSPLGTQAWAASTTNPTKTLRLPSLGLYFKAPKKRGANGELAGRRDDPGAGFRTAYLFPLGITECVSTARACPRALR